jgi:hypothetical protein
VRPVTSTDPRKGSWTLQVRSYLQLRSVYDVPVLHCSGVCLMCYCCRQKYRCWGICTCSFCLICRYSWCAGDINRPAQGLLDTAGQCSELLVIYVDSDGIALQQAVVPLLYYCSRSRGSCARACTRATFVRSAATVRCSCDPRDLCKGSWALQVSCVMQLDVLLLHCGSASMLRYCLLPILQLLSHVEPTNVCLLLLLLQGVCNGLAIATLSAPNHPPRLMLAPVPASLTGSSSTDSSSTSWDWTPVQALEPDLSLLPEAAAALADLECEVLDLVPTVGDTDLHFQAVVQVRAICELFADSLVHCTCRVGAARRSPLSSSSQPSHAARSYSSCFQCAGLYILVMPSPVTPQCHAARSSLSIGMFHRLYKWPRSPNLGQALHWLCWYHTEAPSLQ